ncbi:PREDICTED: uncharacterized protein At3g43530-like [Brassica oleracea var. oleracea]|uniref:uncharacterized protein At3g43530-like n=1 Tax=Brassica oleracea var. oleracea TaxID=109376 RepID=UPI0006A703DC|nr:PREDICTED: uncharacterized protein At3g43530-like [Brassica oleracea var. oleracea]
MASQSDTLSENLDSFLDYTAMSISPTMRGWVVQQTFINKYFEGKRVTYADLEMQMLAMKSKPSEDRKKMAALYFLASILVGGRKSGEGASPVDNFFMTVVDDLDACVTFPWGRYAFEHNLKDVFSFLEKFRRVGYLQAFLFLWRYSQALHLLAFEAIPSLRNHFLENVSVACSGCARMCKMQYKRKSGTKEFSLNAVNDKLGNNTKDIESILVATAAEKELLETIGMDKESCWADDADDAAVDQQFGIDIEARTAKIEGPTNPIGGPSNNAESGQAHADSVEAAGARALKKMEGRLMNAVRDAVLDAMNEVNEKVTSLSNQLNLVEEEVKRLRLSGSDNPSDQDDGSEEKESEEEDGGDKESETDGGGDKDSARDDGGDKESERDDGDDDEILDITKEIYSEHDGDSDGDGDVDMDDDDAEMYAHADEVERNLEDKAETEKARTVKTKKKRSR